MMKRLMALIWCFLLTAGMMNGFAQTNDITGASVKAADTLQIGDYFTLGKYMEEPIVWRYVADDENGRLMISRKSLCRKPFGGSSFWEESFIRNWLNSDVKETEAQWTFNGLNEYDVRNFKTEAGFLNENNFSLKERSIIKSVTQWTMLPADKENLATNGIEEPYDAIKKYLSGNPRDVGGDIYYDIAEFPEAYHGAAHKTTDTIFLLDEKQIYNIWNNFGRNAQAIKIEWKDDGNDSIITSSYFLRTPLKTGNNCTVIHSNGSYGCANTDGLIACDIRSAFYLNEDTAVILSGSGTEDAPYVISGRTENDEPANNKPEGITVFYNGFEISFDQSPFIEKDRVLVPMRAIFEAFGAEVEWNEEEQSVTATCGTDVIKMWIGDAVIMKNETVIESEVAPQVIGYRTFVPLRVIAESLDADVDWIDEEQKVVISG